MSELWAEPELPYRRGRERTVCPYAMGWPRLIAGIAFPWVIVVALIVWRAT